jgi:hypothetical protein
MEPSKSTVQRPRRRPLRKATGEFLSARIQKSYFMLSSTQRSLLNTALEKWRPGRHEPVLVGGLSRLKTALKLMGVYRLVIEEVEEARAITSYTRWVGTLEAAQRIAGHANSRTTKLYDRRGQKVVLEDMERIRY